MTNQQLLHAIGGIDDRFITAAVPKEPKRHMIRWYAAVAACLCLVMVGVGLWQNRFFTKPDPLPTPNGTETVPNDPVPGPEAMGGDDNHAYHYAYLSKLYMMDNELITLLEQQGHKVQQWLIDNDNATKQTVYKVSEPDDVPLLLEAIEEFNISRKTIEELNRKEIEYYQKDYPNLVDELCFTEEELDALFSKDPITITRVFASPYAVVVNDRPFAPHFYLNATEEELQKYGITQEMIEQKRELLYEDEIIPKP